MKAKLNEEKKQNGASNFKANELVMIAKEIFMKDYDFFSCFCPSALLLGPKAPFLPYLSLSILGAAFGAQIAMPGSTSTFAMFHLELICIIYVFFFFLSLVAARAAAAAANAGCWC